MSDFFVAVVDDLGSEFENFSGSLPPKSVCHQRFKLWTETGVLRRAWERMVELKDDLRELDLDTLLGDATFIHGKKRRQCVGPTESSKGAKIELLTDRQGVPLHATIHSPSPHEVTLIEQLITTTPIRLPRQTRLIYDKAADSKPLRGLLKCLGIRLICPFIKPQNKPLRHLTECDRRHYRNRWKIERTLAWLKHFRRPPKR
jgi:transposase